MIFASQDKESEGFVMFLSIVIAVANIVLLAWSVMLFAAAYKSERDAEKARELEEELAANGGINVKRSTLLDIVNDKRRWVKSRLTSKETTQKRLRSRTVSSQDLRNQTNVNPLEGIEMPTISKKGSDGRNADGGEGAARVGDQTSPGMQPPPPAPTRRNPPGDNTCTSAQQEVETDGNNEDLQRPKSVVADDDDDSETLRVQRVRSMNAKKKGMSHENPMQKNKSSTESDTRARM